MYVATCAVRSGSEKVEWGTASQMDISSLWLNKEAPLGAA